MMKKIINSLTIHSIESFMELLQNIKQSKSDYELDDIICVLVNPEYITKFNAVEFKKIGISYSFNNFPTDVDLIINQCSGIQKDTAVLILDILGNVKNKKG